MTDQNGPQRGDPSDSVYDPNPDTSYDEDFAYTGAGTGAAGAASGAAAGGDGLSPEMEKEKPAGGAPLRGLAMILTAVAVILIAWGVYSFVGGDSGDGNDSDTVASQDDGDEGDTQNGDGAEGADGDGAAGAGDADGADGVEGADGDGAEGADGADGDTGGNADGADGAAGQDGADGAPAEVDRAGTAVTVLNNSGDPVAQSAADRLRDEQWSDVGYGNLQGRVTGISEESRVYYPEGNAAAQAAAEELGSDLGIPASAGNPDYYDRFGEADVRNGPRADNVVVVLTGPLG